MDGSVYSCIVGDGMQQVKSWLSLSRTDRSYLYPPHLSPTSGTENKMNDCWEMGAGDERRKCMWKNPVTCPGKRFFPWNFAH